MREKTKICDNFQNQIIFNSNQIAVRVHRIDKETVEDYI